MLMNLAASWVCFSQVMGFAVQEDFEGKREGDGGDNLFGWSGRWVMMGGGCVWMMAGVGGKGDEERRTGGWMGRLMIATVPLLVSQAAHCGLALSAAERAGHGSARRREFSLTRLLRLACEVVPVQGPPDARTHLQRYVPCPRVLGYLLTFHFYLSLSFFSFFFFS